MSLELVLMHVLLPSAVAVAAAVGAWRCSRLLGYGRDPRLLKLMWFYGLFSASLVPVVIWTAQLAADVGGTLPASSLTLRDVHERFAASERVDLFLLAHHALMLTSLAVAVQAFGYKRKQAVAAAAAALAFLSPFVLLALAAEAAMTLFLAVQAIRNHLDRRSPGALQIAAGFSLFFLGHLSFFLFYHPVAARNPLGDAAALIGVVLLVRLLPRASA